MGSDIVLTVDDGFVADAASFFAAGVYLLDLLGDLAENASVKWSVAELRRASAVSGLVADGDYREAGVAAALSAVRGLAAIREGRGLPQDWTPEALTHAKDLVRSSGVNAKVETRDNVVWLDATLRNRIEEIAPWVREYFGMVRGRLTGVNVTRGNRASVKPHGGGRVVQVGFPSTIAQKLADGLFQFVEVEGMVKQNEDGRVYQVAAEDVRVVEESPVPWEELFGYVPEITDGLSVADYLEGIRGEE